MATLVLTTVGGAIGGPIGAALGAIVGQRVDRELLLAPKARSGPRLTDLAVQTSTYGTAIPRIWGRMRVAGCVIWSTDLIETRGSARAGKGQPTTTTYSYSASFAVALSARPIVAVERIWADGKLLRGAAGDWKTRTGFRLHTGGEAQAADPLIAGAVAPAPAHRGIAYAVFEGLQLADFGNRIPSLTFEVVADAAAPTIGAVARGLGVGTGDGPAETLAGFAASGDTLAGAAAVLATVSGGWFVPDGAAMALRNRVGPPRPVTPATVTRTRRPADEVPLAITLAHHDPARDYQIGTQRARSGGAGWRETRIEAAVALSAERAKAIAAAALTRAEASRETRGAVLDAGALAIVPGDAVRLPDDARTWRVKRSAVEGYAVTLDLVAAPPAVDARPADAGVGNPAPDVIAGRTLIEAFELPPVEDVAWNEPRLVVAAAGTGAGWRAATLSCSRDGSASWDPAGGTAAPATMGVIAAPLARGSVALADHAHAIEVALAHDAMTLAAVTAERLDRGDNAALVGDELVQFADARQLAPGRWRLSGLLRGRRGTVSCDHAAGTRFVLLERDTLAALAVPAARRGEVLRVMAEGVGDGEEPARATLAVSGRSVAPPAPVHLACVRESGGGAVLRWIRRSRIGWRWEDGGDVPLGEEREAYRVTIAGVPAPRVVVTDLPELRLSAAECVPGVVATVVQLGTLAESPPASIAIGEMQA